VLHDGIPYDPIQGQGQGHGGLEIAQMANFKVNPPVCMSSKK